MYDKENNLSIRENSRQGNDGLSKEVATHTIWKCHKKYLLYIKTQSSIFTTIGLVTSDTYL